jgi:hypothetical protein
MADELVALRRFKAAFDICDANRGRFSCAGAHDLRCPKARSFSADAQCECGGDALEEALLALEAFHE